MPVVVPLGVSVIALEDPPSWPAETPVPPPTVADSPTPRVPIVVPRDAFGVLAGPESPPGDALAPTLICASRLQISKSVCVGPVVVLPIANHDNNQHGADENVRIANIWYGIDLWATLLTTEFPSD